MNTLANRHDAALHEPTITGCRIEWAIFRLHPAYSKTHRPNPARRTQSRDIGHKACMTGWLTTASILG
jgi:hypothetical protein